jgi:lipopolysaccharide export system permease protein
MRLAGVSLPRLFAPVLVFGLIVAGLTFLTNEVVTPWANQRANRLLRRAVLGDAFPEVREQVFLRGPGDRVLYVRQVDDRAGLLRDVMIYEPSGPLPRLITAREAVWSARTWVLRSGVVREVDADGFTTYEAGFDAMEINVGLDAGTFIAGQRTPEEMTARELRRQVDVFRPGLSPRVAIEYHRKFAIPAASLIFALIAAPLSLQAARGTRFVGVGLSITLLFAYYAIMSTARALGSSGALSPFLAAWTPNLVFLAAGAVLVASQDGRLRSALVVPRSIRAAGARP